MNRLTAYLIILCVLSLNVAYAQNNRSKPKSFNIVRNSSSSSSTSNYDRTVNAPKGKVKPPILTIPANSIVFDDGNKNGIIDAEESCKITFTLKNDGIGDAIGCVVRVDMIGKTSGILAHDVQVDRLPVGQSRSISVPINSDINTVDGAVDFSLKVEEPMGFGTDPFKINVKTKQYIAPYLKVVDYAVSNSSSGKLEKTKQFDLQVLLQNTQYGLAENVVVDIKLPDNVFLVDGSLTKNYTSMVGGSSKSITCTLIANNNYALSYIPITVAVREKHGKYAENKSIRLELDQPTGVMSKTVVAMTETKFGEIKTASFKSDVDKDIPEAAVRNDNALVMIIANEHYKYVESVPFALNDGRIFKEYCKNTLGIPEDKILLVEDASTGDMISKISVFRDRMSAFPDSKVIFYYAGHGVPDESNRTAYMLPIDLTEKELSGAYKLDRLYKMLGEIPSQFVTVFIDACFGGSKREGDMIASSRGAIIKVREEEPVGNMVVFTASKGDETAYSYKDKQHGMFTYFLLKKLQSSKGDVSLGELMDYVTTNVKQTSILLNGKLQTPSVIPSYTLGENWKSKMLK